jgi:hypothetical protein
LAARSRSASAQHDHRVLAAELERDRRERLGRARHDLLAGRVEPVNMTMSTSSISAAPVSPRRWRPGRRPRAAPALAQPSAISSEVSGVTSLGLRITRCRRQRRDAVAERVRQRVVPRPDHADDAVDDVHPVGDRPKTVCLPSSHGAASVVTMKNCEPFVFGPGVGHRERAADDLVVVDLVLERVAGAAGAGAGRVAALDHEVLDHAVEDHAVVEAVAGELAEVLDGLRRVLVEQLDVVVPVPVPVPVPVLPVLVAGVEVVGVGVIGEPGVAPAVGVLTFGSFWGLAGVLAVAGGWVAAGGVVVAAGGAT